MEAPQVDELLDVEDMTMPLEEPNISPKIAIEMGEQDRADMEYILSEIDKQIAWEYAQAFALEGNLLAKVRAQANGMWLQNPDGSFVEDWSRIDLKDMEKFIQAASSETFFASQKVINNYAEAVFAKYSYDDAYEDEYVAILHGTINDKTARAKRRTQKERWIALYKTLYYKRAKEVVDRLDAHVRRVERIYQERQKEIERSFRAAR